MMYPAWIEMKGSRAGNGYIYVRCHGKSRLLHSLILEAFKGPRPLKTECCHNDGNPVNNRLDNLRWGTHQENQRDALRHGTRKTGELSPNAKLSNQQVDEIRQLRESGVAPSVIARRFGINDSYVSQIVKGRKRARIVIPE
jgi:DNA-binding transcriptional regulator YiaG